VNAIHPFVAARDRLLALRSDYETAKQEFAWPRLEQFNWVTDYFEPMARGNSAPALRVIDDTDRDTVVSFEELAKRANQVAGLLCAQGIRPGDRLLVMLGNDVPLWEIMLAGIKLGAVIIPATTLLQQDELTDRIERGRVKGVVTEAALAERHDVLQRVPVRIATGGAVKGWLDYSESQAQPTVFTPAQATRAGDLLFLYFTSGTTARAKLVAHTHQSYPFGHLTTMYWIGLQPGDVHLNLSSPGWAKHAWSCFFAPWNAGATVVAYQYNRFSSRALLDRLVQCGVTTFCAPPTVWRMLIQEDLRSWPVKLREAVSAGEPLNPEVIEAVEAAWKLTIRDGFGQTETTAIVGNPPGQKLKAGSMGRPLPGCPVVLVDADGAVSNEGEICLDLRQQPLNLMRAYLDDAERTANVMRDGFYHTGDVASRDDDGYITYVGRMDDVFKSSDYRISPFELESVLVEHAAVVEAAVVPSPDPVRLCVPKAFVVLANGAQPDAETALSIFEHVRGRVSPFRRVRRIEFRELPKTISGKIRRVELRNEEMARGASARNTAEFWEEDFAQLRSRG
jgi:acetyl-CoA synthetase